MTEREKQIIRDSILIADVWGLGRLSCARETLLDNGYVWTKEHEQYLYECGQNV